VVNDCTGAVAMVSEVLGEVVKSILEVGFAAATSCRRSQF